MTDDLHDALKTAHPDEAARARGRAAAMAAFDAEFGTSEKNIATPQGSDAQRRLTDQKARKKRVDPRRRGMTRLSRLALTVGGTGIAAVLALFIVVKQNDDGLRFGQADKTFSGISGELAGNDTLTPLEMVPAPFKVRGETAVVVPPISEDDLLDVVPATFKNPNQTAEAISDGNSSVTAASGRSLAQTSNAKSVAVPGKTATIQTRVIATPAGDRRMAKPGASSNNSMIIVGAAEQVGAAPKERQRVYSGVRRVAIPGKTAIITTRVLQEDGSIKATAQTAPVEEPAESIQIVPGSVTDGGFAAPQGYELKVKPATYKTVEVVVPVLTNWKGEVLETRTVQRRVVVTPSRTVFVPIDPNSGLEDLPMSAAVKVERNRFVDFTPNPVTVSAETPISTFSIDVDTAAYSFLRSTLNRGQLPQAAQLRIEELINYFPYDYAAPDSANEPFRANVSVTPNPWNADTKLMHIGIKGYVPPASERPRSNLVFLIDTSGSMDEPNKLPLLVNSFKLMLDTLDEDDTVSIVTYAGYSGFALKPTPASNKSTIYEALDALRSGGGTAGAAGLELAYQKAAENFDPKGINRVILATDGDFNVGFSSPSEMKSFVETKRKSGIFLSVLGFGRGNYNDALMQALAQNGNGVAAYIDTLSEARKVLADEAGGALIPIAKDVKIQVEFNPAVISEYRLIGYETRALAREDFNDDTVDAGDINSGHTVTAIYEITPKGSPAESTDPLRYGSKPLTVSNETSDEMAFVKIRHKLPDNDISTLQTRPVTGADEVNKLENASTDARFAISVAALGQMLRGQSQLAEYDYDAVIEMATRARGDDAYGYRAEFITLVRLAKSLDRDR